MARGGARARLRVPRDHRPLGHARLRQRRHARASCAARSSACASSTSALDGIELLIGTETNILPDGSPDYDGRPARRARLGRSARVHTSFGMDEEAMTERIVAAIEHPLGRRDRPPHRPQDRAPRALRARPRPLSSPRPRGRARCSRSTPRPTAATSTTSTRAPPRAAGRADPHRLRRARRATRSPNTRWGVATARRAWLTAADVANTLPWAEFAPLRKRARRLDAGAGGAPPLRAQSAASPARTPGAHTRLRTPSPRRPE